MEVFTLITGATSGIGMATAKKLSKSKKLILAGRNQKKLEELKQELGENHLLFCCDLNEVELIGDRLSSFLKLCDYRVDKLVHCAGMNHALSAKSLNASNIDALMRVNFYSVVEIVKVLIKRSVNQSTLKNVLLISSISAIRGFKAKAAYSASKAALNAYMRVLAKELAPHVSVNSILPGAMKTPMTQSDFDNSELVKQFEEAYPLGIGNVQQLVKVIQFYHDTDDLWVTGQQIVVDGGMTS
jgi:NAD(P)-dependent dehydrogenase (short-subunit alcohol dehydrogenase family)